jgi:hypothetical protein
MRHILNRGGSAVQEANSFSGQDDSSEKGALGAANLSYTSNRHEVNQWRDPQARTYRS